MTITTQKELRAFFWQEHPKASRKKNRDGDYVTDTRVSFVDFIDQLCRNGMISDALALRATL